LTQADREGLIGRALSTVKFDASGAPIFEKPPGAKRPISCGFSHRWIIGRDLLGASYAAAVSARKAARLVKRQLREQLQLNRSPFSGRMRKLAPTDDEMRQRARDAREALAAVERDPTLRGLTVPEVLRAIRAGPRDHN
jgi:hypothetical protein